MKSRPTALVLSVLLLGAACGRGGAAPTPADDGVRAAQVRQDQLTDRALAGLARRRCTPLPAGPVLESLPSAQLRCLGTGPARPARAGDGRPTLVNLWASWCRPCLQEMPLLQRAAVAAGSGVRFVGIDTEDSRASAAGMLDATGVTYVQYEDPGAAVRTGVRVLGLPATLVFDARGRLVAKRVGKVDEAWLQTALARARS